MRQADQSRYHVLLFQTSCRHSKYRNQSTPSFAYSQIKASLPLNFSCQYCYSEIFISIQSSRFCRGIRLLSQKMSRYIIIGCSGSGKSTVARKIAETCDLPYYDTDSLYWRKGWGLSTDEEVIAALPLDSERWVIDGNFVGHRDTVWKRATSIVWLDLPARTIMFRVTRRNLGWWIRRTPTWSGNRMPLRIALSGILHAWKQLRRTRDRYPSFLKEFNHAATHRIKDRSEVNALLCSLTSRG